MRALSAAWPKNFPWFFRLTILAFPSRPSLRHPASAVRGSGDQHPSSQELTYPEGTACRCNLWRRGNQVSLAGAGLVDFSLVCKMPFVGRMTDSHPLGFEQTGFRLVSFSMRKKATPRRLKTFLVALDRPGRGWSATVRAFAPSGAAAAAKRKFRESPDTVYEVGDDFVKTQAENRAQEPYERLDGDDFLVALSLEGALPEIGDRFPNERMWRAMNARVGMLKENAPRMVSRVKELLSLK